MLQFFARTPPLSTRRGQDSVLSSAKLQTFRGALAAARKVKFCVLGAFRSFTAVLRVKRLNFRKMHFQNYLKISTKSKKFKNLNTDVLNGQNSQKLLNICKKCQFLQKNAKTPKRFKIFNGGFAAGENLRVGLPVRHI